MKTKTTFLKHVICSLCILWSIVVYNRTHAQIVYTDIPDATPNASYYLDLNNDSTVDFLIYFGGSAGSAGVMCAPYNNNAYAGEFVSSLHLPRAIPTSYHICDTMATWYDSSKPGIMALGTSVGNWIGVSDKYLALKLIVGTNTYYGWARLDISTNSTPFTIKDYAYESKPNTCIQTGQTISGINEYLVKNSISILPNPFKYSTTIKTCSSLNNANLTTYNACGQTVLQLNNISGQSLSLFRDNLPSGLYFLILREENKIFAIEKFIITD